jgi:AraC-like DNA-binding protein
MVFAKAALDAFTRVPKYFSAEESCIMYLTKGDFQMRTPDKVLSFQMGEALIAKCGPYYIECTRDYQGPVEAVAVYFHPSVVQSIFAHPTLEEPLAENYDVKHQEIDRLIELYFKGIDYLLEHPALCTDTLVELKMKELILLLVKTDQRERIHRFLQGLFQPYRYEFKTIIERNRTANLSLAELARMCHMSLATFKRTFAKHYEVSPAKYFLNARLEQAALLLKTRMEQSIATVVDECGFESITHFNRVFKQRYGCTPGEWRMS